MAIQNPIEKPVKVKERGEGFPRLSLPSAVTIMEKASKYGRQWTRDQFASFSSKSGTGSAKSGAFSRRIASLRDFGLIQTSGLMILKTDLADQIVKPIKPVEREGAIKQAFLKVDVFRAIVETVSHDVDLSKNDIIEMAVKQLGVSRAAKDYFISSFVESGEFAALIKEVDKDTIQISPSKIVSTSEEKKLQEIEPVNSNQNISSTAITPILDSIDITDTGSTIFNAMRKGKTWDLSIQIRSSLSIDSEVINKIVKLLQDGEEIAKELKKTEERDVSSDNQG